MILVRALVMIHRTMKISFSKTKSIKKKKFKKISREGGSLTGIIFPSVIYKIVRRYHCPRYCRSRHPGTTDPDPQLHRWRVLLRGCHVVDGLHPMGHHPDYQGTQERWFPVRAHRASHLPSFRDYLHDHLPYQRFH